MSTIAVSRSCGFSPDDLLEDTPERPRAGFSWRLAGDDLYCRCKLLIPCVVSREGSARRSTKGSGISSRIYQPGRQFMGSREPRKLRPLKHSGGHCSRERLPARGRFTLCLLIITILFYFYCSGLSRPNLSSIESIGCSHSSCLHLFSQLVNKSLVVLMGFKWRLL